MAIQSSKKEQIVKNLPSDEEMQQNQCKRGERHNVTFHLNQQGMTLHDDKDQ